MLGLLWLVFQIALITIGFAQLQISVKLFRLEKKYYDEHEKDQ